MEKIPFVDYVCQQIVKGEFVSASTKCNYLINGTVDSGDRVEHHSPLNPEDHFGFDPDAFRLRIEPSLFGRNRKVILYRYTGKRTMRQLTVTREQSDQLHEAWKIAASIQEKRNADANEERKKQTDALHWWP